MESKLDTSCIIVLGSIDAFDSWIWRISICSAVFSLLIDAYHFKGKIAHLNISTQKFFIVFRTKLFCLLIAYDKHFTTLIYINIIDKTAVKHLHFLNLCMVWVDATDRGWDILLSQTNGCRSTILRSHLINILLKFRLRSIDVTLLEIDPAAFLKTMICFWGFATIDNHRRRQETLVLQNSGIYEAIARAQQHNEHKDSPCHSKACKRSTQFVAPGSRPYFTYYISHNLFTSSCRWYRMDLRCDRGSPLSDQ